MKSTYIKYSLKTIICFSLTIISFSVFAQPANDDPCSATALTVNTSCSYTSGTNVSATASAGVPAPGCASYGGGDVWFTITVPAGGAVTVTGDDNGGFTDGGMAIYSGTCGSLSLISCNDDSGPGLHPEITLTGQTPGATLWIRYWEYGNNSFGTFDICATQPAPPPANDDCSGAYAVTVNPDFSCSSTTAGTVASATASSQSQASCGGTEDDDVWFSFVATGTTHTIDLLNIAGSTTDLYHSVWTGTCPTLSLVAGTCSDPNSQTLTGLTPGTTYYIRVYSWTSTTGQTTTFDVCVGTPPPPPANDDCSGAYAVTVNPDFSCSSTTAGTVASATASSQSQASCGGTEDDDVWFSFVATGTTHTIDLLNIAGSTTDLYHSVWTGTCPTLSLVAGTCSDPNSQTLTGLTPGTTYYIRVYSWTSTTGQTTTFDVCVGTPPPPPANDDCSGAYAVTVNSNGACTSTTAGTVASATASSQSQASCGGTEDDDVWFSFTAPASGNVDVNLLNITGSTTDLYHSVWSGTCPTLTLVAGTCSDPNSQSITGLTPGQTYYIRVYSWTSTTGQTTSFDVCVTEPAPNGPCGNPTTNDYCSDPAILSQGGSGWSSSTSNIYSADSPANTGTLFCGSIENNSWYQFTAQSTTETFFFSSVTNCASGIQAEVYEITTDANGCCTNLTSMSNCWNPTTATTGTVTATGLTVGNTYVLMIDGYAGANCDFTVDGWTATGILPVTLINFEGYPYQDYNKLIWSTESEINNDYFIVQKSFDAMNFENIGTVEGNGNSTVFNSYSFIDNTPSYRTYYRLKQVDFDGKYEYSNVIYVNRLDELGVFLYPNPSKGRLNIDITQNNIESSSIIISFTDIVGKQAVERINISEGKNTYQSNKFGNLSDGLYFIQIKTDSGELIKTEKIIKE